MSRPPSVFLPCLLGWQSGAKTRRGMSTPLRSGEQRAGRLCACIFLAIASYQLPKKAGRCYNTIKKRIDEYTEKLGELFSQREIRMLFQQHAKRMVEELKKHATSISFFDEPIYYADRDKSNLSQLLVEGLAHQSECKRESQRKRGGGSACMHLAAKGWYAK